MPLRLFMLLRLPSSKAHTVVNTYMSGYTQHGEAIALQGEDEERGDSGALAYRRRCCTPSRRDRRDGQAILAAWRAAGNADFEACGLARAGRGRGCIYSPS